MKQRTLITSTTLLLVLCLLFTTLGSGGFIALAEEEQQAVMDADREAEESMPEEQPIGLASVPYTKPRVTISADSPERLLYRDDTLIVYTVETPSDCTEVILSLLYREYYMIQQIELLSPEERQELDEIEGYNLWSINKPLYQQSFTPQSDGVTVEEMKDSLVWTIPCDFGFTGAERIAAEAVCSGDDEIHPYGIVNVNIGLLTINRTEKIRSWYNRENEGDKNHDRKTSPTHLHRRAKAATGGFVQSREITQ